MYLSIIIPTYNEEKNITQLISYLRENIGDKKFEIIVSDGNSTDETVLRARELGVKTLISPLKGRSCQMNFGIQNASGNVYYFVHADTLPTATFFDDIQNALDANYNCGSFRFQFDSSKWILKINAFFTRFNYLFFRGGDQTIFVTKKLWQQVGSFNEEMLIMEDYDFLKRIWERGKFKLIPKATVVSARKYETNSWLTVQLANLKVVKMYKAGASQKDMILTYNELLNYRKNAF